MKKVFNLWAWKLYRKRPKYFEHYITVLYEMNLYEPRHEKNNVLHMRKQRRRSASR